MSEAESIMSIACQNEKKKDGYKKKQKNSRSNP